MRPESIEGEYRIFLLLLAGFVFLSTIVELWFTEHFESTLQLVPFVLCGLGFVAVAATGYAPRRGVLRLFR